MNTAVKGIAKRTKPHYSKHDHGREGFKGTISATVHRHISVFLILPAAAKFYSMDRHNHDAQLQFTACWKHEEEMPRDTSFVTGEEKNSYTVDTV